MAPAKSRKPRFALVGSDSLKGKEILSVLNAKKFPLASFEFYDPDVEQEFSKLGQFRHEPKVIHALTPAALEGLDLVFLAADARTVHAAAREARVIVGQGFVREKKTLASVGFFFGAADAAEAVLKGRLAGLDSVRAAHIRSVDDLYASRCKALGVKPEKAGPTKDETRLAGLVPVRTEKMGGLMSMWNLRDELRKLDYQPPPSIRMAERELRNFIDGERSVLDIRDAASAEYEPLDLLEVEKWVGIQERLGLVTIKKK